MVEVPTRILVGCEARVAKKCLVCSSGDLIHGREVIC